MTTEDWTDSVTIRITGIALFRQHYEDGVGDLPSSGTMGEIALEQAVDFLQRNPGLRHAIDAGVRALESDPPFQLWLMTLYSGDRNKCAESEKALQVTDARRRLHRTLGAMIEATS